jgi:long-chain acyl-CoA synthetase
MTVTADAPARAGGPVESGLTIPEMFRRTVERRGDNTALRLKKDGKWHPISYRELSRRVDELALGLLHLGVRRGAKVALLSENRPEWATTDLAAVAIGAVNVPLYSTLPPAQVAYIIRDSEAQVVICSNEKQLAKVLEVRDELPRLEHVVVMDPPAEPAEGVLTLAEVGEKGRGTPATELETARRAVQPGDPATIIYTSGTTGDPKGAVLTHDNFMSNAGGLAALVEVRADDLFLSFLPLSHVFERMAGHYLPLLAGSTVAYAESVFAVQNNMVEVKPTVMASVPRLYEAIHSKVADGIQKQPDNKKKMALWAIEVGKRHNIARYAGKSPGLIDSLLYKLAEKLVLAPLRERVTGGRLRFFISGGAPLPVETAQFLTAMGLHILEGYGLTETSPVICVNRPEKTKLGTVGPPISGVEVRIAEDGEILSRGPHIMQGYYNKAEETAKSIDPEGWFHTGDIGVLDEDNYLKITDRKKDIIVLANGKNVAPQPIESKLKASPYMAQVVLFGDREPQVVALVVPDFEHLKRWAKEQGIEERDPEKLIALPQVKKLYRAEFERLTTDLADFEKVRRFTLLQRDFTQERDEVTPSLKIKRRVVRDHYAAEIQAMYGGKDAG